MHKLLTIREFARRLGVSETTAHRWLRRGDLRYVRIGGRRRIPEAELVRLMEEQDGRDQPPGS